ncbi:MAG: DUF1684 domain-containing protein [Gemmatimonadales bacterium]
MKPLRITRSYGLLLATLMPILGCGERAEANTSAWPDPAAYDADLAAWKQRRITSVAGPDGWTTLAGLHWLDSASYRVGSDSANAIVLPAGAPGRLGTVERAAGGVRFDAAPAADVRVKGAPVDALVLRSDARGAEPTVLEAGSVTLRVIERSGRLALRVKDTLHPARAAFEGLEYFPVDTSWRLRARLVPHDEPKTLAVIDVVGQVQTYESPGALEFTHGGEGYRLDAVIEPGVNDLFVMFRDKTSARETYPAGRYVYAPVPDSTGTTVLDFNRAYNPPCAFTALATCPLPPGQNVLPIPIRAGELRYHEPGKKAKVKA